MKLDLQKLWQNVSEAETGDLLDRVTAYRAGMEPEAIEIIEEELSRRGVDAQKINAWREKQPNLLHYGLPAQCSFCPKPAVHEGWGWHRFWGVLPLFLRRFRYCEQHAPQAKR